MLQMLVHIKQIFTRDGFLDYGYFLSCWVYVQMFHCDFNYLIVTKQGFTHHESLSSRLGSQDVSHAQEDGMHHFYAVGRSGEVFICHWCRHLSCLSLYL